MKEESQNVPIENTLTSVTEKLEAEFATFVRENPNGFRSLFVLATLVVLSPLVLFWLDGGDGKDWSETVKNVVESVAVLGGLFVVFKWVNERRDRATDVLLNLEKEFKDEGILAGRTAVEDADHTNPKVRCDKLDGMLRFYVVLYGVYVARQVPRESLSVCFRYWLAHYFHKDRKNFREYLENYYPTLTRWLREDCKGGGTFFTPRRFFKERTDESFIEKCRTEPIP